MGYIRIAAGAYREMVRHCMEEKPLEACGLLSGSEGTVGHCWNIRNVNQSPVSFAMDMEQVVTALQQMKQHNEQLLGIYHSHPNSYPYPSTFDIEHVAYPCSYLIVSLNRLRPRVRSYRITGGDVQHEPIWLVPS